jgi:hypothetical protein
VLDTTTAWTASSSSVVGTTTSSTSTTPNSTQEGDTLTDNGDDGTTTPPPSQDDDDDDDEVDASSDIMEEPNRFGVQLDGLMYAGGLAYDADKRAVYFTAGATYNNNNTNNETSTQSKCIFGTLTLQDQDHSSHVVTLGGHTTAVDTPEACSATALSLSASTQQAYMVGDTTAGGLMTEFANTNTNTNTNTNDTTRTYNTQTHFGFVAQATIQEGDTQLQRTGGYLLKEVAVADAVVTYPVAVVTIHVSSVNHVVVASMGSTTVASETTADAAKPEFPHWTSGGHRRFYGFSNYYLRLTQLKTLGGLDPAGPNVMRRKTLRVASDVTYQTDYYADYDTSVYTTGMASVGQESSESVLVVVGSTRGWGGIFGQQQQDRTDMDGFLAKFGPSATSYSGGGHQSPTCRINSVNNKDDWILHLCTDPTDSSVVYVVGATMGYDDTDTTKPPPPEGSIHPYIAKMDLETMEPRYGSHNWKQPPATMTPPPLVAALRPTHRPTDVPYTTQRSMWRESSRMAPSWWYEKRTLYKSRRERMISLWPN